MEGHEIVFVGKVDCRRVGRLLGGWRRLVGRRRCRRSRRWRRDRRRRGRLDGLELVVADGAVEVRGGNRANNRGEREVRTARPEGVAGAAVVVSDGESSCLIQELLGRRRRERVGFVDLNSMFMLSWFMLVYW